MLKFLAHQTGIRGVEYIDSATEDAISMVSNGRLHIQKTPVVERINHHVKKFYINYFFPNFDAHSSTDNREKTSFIELSINEQSQTPAQPRKLIREVPSHHNSYRVLGLNFASVRRNIIVIYTSVRCHCRIAKTSKKSNFFPCSRDRLSR